MGPRGCRTLDTSTARSDREVDCVVTRDTPSLNTLLLIYLPARDRGLFEPGYCCSDVKEPGTLSRGNRISVKCLGLAVQLV
jgi:hypothetical protein